MLRMLLVLVTGFVILGEKALVALPPSSVVLTSSANPSTFGASLMLTAKVTPASATGTVTFYDGTSVLGSSPISAGTAGISTILLASSSHLLKAYYGGSSNVSPGTSSGLAQLVAPVAATIFTAATFPKVGVDPTSVAIGDFNGDGKADLAVSNLVDNNVSILLSNGNGTFAPALNFAVGQHPHSLKTGDFNGDGKIDLAVASEYPGTTILLGQGDGTFATIGTVGPGATSVVVADFNGDGKADLAVTNYAPMGSSFISVLLGDGNGTFAPAMNYFGAAYTETLAVGDFNGDGKPDLAVTNLVGDLGILLGKGDGTFGVATSYPEGEFAQFVAVGDFNGDGKTDLAVANGNGHGLSILLGNGNGAFAAPVNYALAGSLTSSIAVGDLNGDGKPDLAVTDSNSLLSILLGNGDGTFSAPVVYPIAGSRQSSVAIGDFNGDGRADLAATNFQDYTVSILLGGVSPAGSSFVTGEALIAGLRNNFDGNVGMQFTVGNSPITLKALGRFVAAGNSQVHELSLVNVSTGVVVTSTHVNLAGAQPGQFQFAALPSPVVLQPNTPYYLVSRESSGGDQWYDFVPVSAGMGATVNSPVYQQSDGVYKAVSAPGYSYVPLSFLFLPGAVTGFTPPSVSVTSPVNGASVSGTITLTAAASAAPSLSITSVQFQVGTSYLAPITSPPYTATFDTTTLSSGSQVTITATATDSAYNSATSAPVQVTVGNAAAGPTPFLSGSPSSSLRNNYSGYVGMQFTVGNAPLLVSKLGRWVAPGNTQTHGLILVNATTGNAVPYGNIFFSLNGVAPGQYFYAALTSPVTLQANTSYFLLSVETAGGDQWYDYGPVIPTSAAQVNGPVYTDASGNHVLVHLSNPNASYVPVNFVYQPVLSSNPFLTGPPSRSAPLRNNYTGFVGMELNVGSSPVTVTQLGRWVVPGSTQSHLIKLVDASSGLDVLGGSLFFQATSFVLGQYEYASLLNPITLTANTSYYLVSQEYAGGDLWYDYAPVTTSNVASTIGPVYTDSSGKYVPLPQFPGQSYVPVTFTYSP